MKIFLILSFLLFAQVLSAQVTFVEKSRATELKNAADVVVVLASQDPKVQKRLPKKNKDTYEKLYHLMLEDYNSELRNAFSSYWTFTKIIFLTKAELADFKKKHPEPNRLFFIATGDADARLSEAIIGLAKHNKTTFDRDEFLVSSDKQSSIDILNASQFNSYFTLAADWDLLQQQKMEQDAKLGKSPEPGDQLKHKQLEYVGFYLSQHALPTPSDFQIALHYLQADLEKSVENPKKSLVNQVLKVNGASLIHKTLLVGTDLVNFPDGKVSLTGHDIKSMYPYPFKIVGQAEIERAMAAKDPAFAVIVPGVRWSPTGYPELKMFWVVDAADGVTVLSFADTGSGGNAMTSGNFEKSVELKAKHFQEIVTNAGIE